MPLHTQLLPTPVRSRGHHLMKPTEPTLRQLNSCLVPGVNDSPWVPKGSGCCRLSWLTRRYNIAWRSGMVVPIFKKGDQLDLPRSPCSGGIQTRVYLILDLFWFNFQPLLIKVILRGLFMVNNYFIISLKMSFLQVGQCWILKVPPPTWWEFIMAFLSFGKLLQDSSMRAYNVLVFLNLLLLKDHGIPLLMITDIGVNEPPPVIKIRISCLVSEHQDPDGQNWKAGKVHIKSPPRVKKFMLFMRREDRVEHRSTKANELFTYPDHEHEYWLNRMRSMVFKTFEVIW